MGTSKATSDDILDCPSLLNPVISSSNQSPTGDIVSVSTTAGLLNNGSDNPPSLLDNDQLMSSGNSVSSLPSSASSSTFSTDSDTFNKPCLSVVPCSPPVTPSQTNGASCDSDNTATCPPSQSSLSTTSGSSISNGLWKDLVGSLPDDITSSIIPQDGGLATSCSGYPSNSSSSSSSNSLPLGICQPSSSVCTSVAGTSVTSTSQSILSGLTSDTAMLQHCSNDPTPSLQSVTSDDSKSDTQNWSLNRVKTSCGTWKSTSYFDNSSLSPNSLPPRKRVRLDSVKLDCSDNTSVLTSNSDLCVNCQTIPHDLRVSRCVQGHVACGECLEEQAKKVLKGKEKNNSLTCIKDSCESYYPLSELKHSLPPMVVDILEEKAESDFFNYVDDLMLGQLPPNGKNDTSIPATSTTSQATVTAAGMGTNPDMSGDNSSDLDDNLLMKSLEDGQFQEENRKTTDLPENWDEMEPNVTLKTVDLTPESPEYIEVAIRFHETLSFPSADIQKITRVQNPIQWRYYQLKKMEMIQENDGHAVLEKKLFHGTSDSVVEAICRKGFDWRMSGKHGTVYGQGSYFARDSCYSHQYTEKGRHRGGSAFLTRNSSSSTSATIVTHPASRAFIFCPLKNFASTPPPAHMPSSSQNIIPVFSHAPSSSLASSLPQAVTIKNANLGNLLTVTSSSTGSGSRNPGSSNSVTSSQPSSRTSGWEGRGISRPQTNSKSATAPVSSKSNSNSSSNMYLKNMFKKGGAAKVVPRGNALNGNPSISSSNSASNDSNNNSNIIINNNNINNNSSYTPACRYTGFHGLGQSGLPPQPVPTNNASNTVVSVSGPTPPTHLPGPAHSLQSPGSAFVAHPIASLGVTSLQKLAQGSSSAAQGGASPSAFNSASMSFRRRKQLKAILQKHKELRRCLQQFMPSGLSQPPASAIPSTSSTHKMFYARVLVGRFTGGNSTLRKPPPLDPDTEPYGKFYDSCVDNIFEPKIFVIFDSNQAFPEYIIEYSINQ